MLLAPSIASAEFPHVLRPGTRPFFASFAMAPAFGLSSSKTQVKIAEGLGWHLDGTASGPAIGLELQESFGSDAFTFETGAKLLWDIQPADGLAFYITPSAMLGIGYVSSTTGSDFGDFGDFGQSNSSSTIGFDMQFGLEAKLGLGDRGFVSFRPFTLDIMLGDTTPIRWDMMFAGGVAF
jgi:hypothetical protein